MKKQLTITIFLLGLAINMLAQSCLPDGMHFYRQDQIDNFTTNFPNCTEIEGDVTISELGNYVITNLDGLGVLTAVGGDLTISYLESLTSLHGLHNITSVGGKLDISGTSLVDMQGLSSLEYIGGSAWLYGGIQSFAGLESLTEINHSLHLL